MNQLAAFVLAEATREDKHEPRPEVNDGKNPNAVAMGKLGGKKGGKARADSLTPEQRSATARRAVNIRWHGRKHED